MLEGSVQKAENKLRTNARLIDALSGRHLWAGRVDRTTSEIFAVQDEITKSVLTELQVELTMGDNARVRSRELFEAAYEADPAWTRPLAASTLTHWFEAKQGWSPSRSESARPGIDFAKRTIELDSNDSLGPPVLGNMYFLIDQPERGIELQRRAIELTPNDFGVVAGMAMRIKDFGQEREAIELFGHAMRLSPKHPWWVPFGYGLALHLVGNKEEAVQAYLKTIAHKLTTPGMTLILPI